MLIARRGDNGGMWLGSPTLSVNSPSVDEGDSLLPFSCRETKDFKRLLSIYRGDIQQWTRRRQPVTLFHFWLFLYFTFQKPKYTIISSRTPWNITKVDALFIFLFLFSRKLASKQTITHISFGMSQRPQRFSSPNIPWQWLTPLTETVWQLVSIKLKKTSFHRRF